MQLNNCGRVSKFLTCLLLLIPSIGIAASGEGVGGLVEFSEMLSEPIGVLTRLVLFASFIVGVAMLIGSALQYRNHLQSPKLVPLTTPIFLAIFGTVALLIPYATTLPEKSGNILKQKQSSSPAFPSTNPSYDETDEEEEEDEDEDEEESDTNSRSPQNYPSHPDRSNERQH